MPDLSRHASAIFTVRSPKLSLFINFHFLDLTSAKFPITIIFINSRLPEPISVLAPSYKQNTQIPLNLRGFKQINTREQCFYINFSELFLSGAKTTPGYRATFGFEGMCNNR